MSDRNTDSLQPSLALLDSNTNPNHVIKQIQRNGDDEENSKQQKCGQWYRDLLSDSPIDSDGLKLIHGNKSLVVKIASFESRESMRDLISKILHNKKKINGIVIAGIEGAFKVDYFKQIELAIREIKKLKMIVIFQTNLGRPHIQILRTMLWKKSENLETLILFKNSIDGFDFMELFASEDFNINDLTSLRELEIRLQPGMQKLKTSQFKQFLNLLYSKYQDSENQFIEHQNHKNEGFQSYCSSCTNGHLRKYCCCFFKSLSILEVQIDKISLSDQNIGLINDQKGSVQLLRIINKENALIDRNALLSLSLSGCFKRDQSKQGLQFLGEVLVSENFDDFIKLDLSEFKSPEPNYWISLFRYFQTQKSLLELNLSDCTLPEDLSKSLFSNDFSILKLNLSNTKISENIVFQLLRFLLFNKKCVITNLFFDGSSLKKDCVDKLKEEIIKLNQKQEQNSDLKFQSTLQHLEICDLNGINSEESVEFFSILFVKVKENLQSLSLRDCYNEENQILGLSQSFEKVFSSRQSLRVFQEITVTGVWYFNKKNLKELFHYLMQKHLNIQKMDFSNCKLSDELISSFMEDFQQSNKSLKVLKLRKNKEIGLEGYKLIGQNLLFSVESNLQELDISENNITNQLDELLKQAEVLNQKNTKLQSWKMNNNEFIDDESFEKLCKYLLFSPLFSLKQISLEFTLVNKEDVFLKILKDLQQKKYISQSLEVFQGFSNSFRTAQLCFGISGDADEESKRDTLHLIFPKLQNLWFECGKQEKQIQPDVLNEKQLYPNRCCLPINEINIKNTENKNFEKFKVDFESFFKNRRLVNLERISIQGLEDQEFLKLLFDLTHEVVGKDENGSSKNKSIQQQNQIKKLHLRYSYLKIDDIFWNLIFSNRSKIEELEINSVNYKQQSLNVFIAQLSTKLNQKQNEFDKHSTYLVDLNLNNNKFFGIQEWKQFFQIFIGKKELSLESPSHSNLRTSQRDTDQKTFISSKLKEIAALYKVQQSSLNIGLNTQTQWDPVFSLLGLEVDLAGIQTNIKIQLLNKLVFKTSSNLERIIFSCLIYSKEDYNSLIQAVNAFCEQQKERNNENKMPFLKIKRLSLIKCSEIDQTEIMSNFLFHEDLWSLEYLQLKSCGISQYGWNQMCQQTQLMLQQKREQNRRDFSNIREIKLKELDLSYNPEIKQIFLPQYQIFPKLESIISDNIDKNQEDEGFYKQITKIRQDNLDKLEFEKLIDKYIKVSSISCSYYSSLLVEKIRQNDQFEELILTEAKMTFQEFENLVFLAASNIHGRLILKNIEIVKDPSQELGQDITALNPCYNSQLKEICISIQQNQVIQTKTRELLIFIAQNCLSLQKLQLQMSDLFKDDDFEAFCKEYSLNKQIKLQKLDLSYNRNISSWSTFFNTILCDDSKNSLKEINLSYCNFSKEDFEKLAACARKMKGKIEIDVFEIRYIEIRDKCPNIFSEYFFKLFVLLDSVKIKRLDVSESFDLSEVGTIQSLLNQHSQSNKCTLVQVKGHDQFDKIMFKKFGFQISDQNFSFVEQQLEPQEFQRFWAKSLASPSLKSIYIWGNDLLLSKMIDHIPNQQFDFVKDFLFPWSNLKKICKSRLEENKRSNQKVEPSQVGVDKKEKGPGENTTDNKISNKEKSILCFDLQILQGLELYFNLNRDPPNEYKHMDIPYPYNLILNPFLADFLKNENEKVTKIPLISLIYFTGLDSSHKIETKHVCSLFQLFKDTNIDTIYLPYELLQSELPESIRSSEKNLIELLLMFPPTSFRLENVSVSALKVIYSIQSTNVFFQNCTVGFSSDSFINNGIAFSSRESLIAGKIRRNNILILFKYITYQFLDIFCSESRIYKFDDSIPKMNTEFQNNRLYFRIMIFTSYVYYLICVLAPYFFAITTTENNQSDSSSTNPPGIHWYSDLIYSLFAIGTLFLERRIFSYIYEKIEHLIPPLIDDSSTEDTSTSCCCNLKNKIFEIIKSAYSKIRQYSATPTKRDQLTYYFKLLLSQIDRLDMYSDVCFIVKCFQVEWSIDIGKIGLIVISMQIVLNLFKLTVICVKEFLKSKKQRLLNTHEINQFCLLSNLLEFEAVNEALDIISPYNVSFIGNNCLMRYLFPNNIGQSYSNRISVCLQKILLEDLIQIGLKIWYLRVQPSDGSDGSAYQSFLLILSFATNIFSILKSFNKVMSMRPSTISQMEFDNLSKKINSKEMKEKTEEKMEGFKKGLFESINEVAKDYKNLISYESHEQKHQQFSKNKNNISHENDSESEFLKKQEAENLPLKG